jgi:integrase
LSSRAVTEKDYPTYQLLKAQKAKADRRGNSAKYAQLDARQKALTRYQPEMMHSISDNSTRIKFHPQLLSDFKTICELSLKIGSHGPRPLASRPRPRSGVHGSAIRHAWRHTFKAIAFRCGVSEKIIDAIVGHAPASVGRAYGEPTLADKAAALSKFPRYKV